MHQLHLSYLLNHSFITKLFFLIILPFVNLSPVRVPDRPFGQFLAYLSENKCIMPNNVKLPFPNSTSEGFAFLDSPLEECGTAEAFNRNETSYVLCNEIFEVIINITCREVDVESEIISEVSGNVCQDFQKLHSVVFNDTSYLGRRLNDNILCTLICNKHKDLCKFMSWSYGVLSRLNALIPDTKPAEENDATHADLTQPGGNTAMHADLAQTGENTAIATGPKQAEENEDTDHKSTHANTDTDHKSTHANTDTDHKSTDTNTDTDHKSTHANTDTDHKSTHANTDILQNEVTELKLPQDDANIKESAGTNVTSTLNHSEVTTGNHPDNSTAMLSNASESSKTEKKSTSSHLSENLPITNIPHNAHTNPTSTIVSNLNDKNVNVLPNSKDKVTVTKTSIEIVNNVSTKFPGAETKVEQEDADKLHIMNPITVRNDDAEKLAAEKNLPSTRNSTESSKDFSSSTVGIPIDQMDDENDIPQSVKFQEQYNDEENEVDIGGEYSKPEYDGYNPPSKVKDQNSKSSNVATDDMGTANLANKYNEFLYKRILDQDSDGVQIIPSFPEQEDSHFFSYLLTIVFILMAAYLISHNKQKIIAIIVEGCHERKRRSHNAGYKKLETK